MDCGAMLDEARHLLADGLQSAASDLLEECLKQDPDDLAVLRLLARIRTRQGRAAETVALLRRALLVQIDQRKAFGPADGPGSVAPPAPVTGCSSLGFADTVDDEDLRFIEARATEYRDRRHLFEPLSDDPFDQDASTHRGSESRDPTVRVTASRSATPDFLPVSAHASRTLDCFADTFACGTSGESSATSDAVESPCEPSFSAPIDRWAFSEPEVIFDIPEDDWGDETDAELKDLTEIFTGASCIETETLDDEIFAAMLGRATELPSSEQPWEAFAFDADEFEEAPTPEELVKVQSEGCLTRRQRARQEAIKLGLEFEWDEDGIAILTDVFDRHWWNSAKRSMRREMEAGLEPEELRLALEIREVWNSHPEFSTDFSGVDSNSWLNAASPVYRTLSWPLALALVRSGDAYADAECMEHRLCELFDEWYTHRTVRRRLQSFNTYLYFRSGMADRELHEWHAWSFEPESALGLEDEDAYQPGYGTPALRVLNDLDLIPRRAVTPRKCNRPKTTGSAASVGPSPSTAPPPSAPPRRSEQGSATETTVMWQGNQLVSANVTGVPEQVSARHRTFDAIVRPPAECVVVSTLPKRELA